MLKSARAERKTLTDVAQQELRQAITSGTYRPGSQLPTEAELCEMLGVSRTVVREALRVLEDDGLVARRHGIGTFVRNRPILKNLNFNFGITEMIESAGLQSGTSHLAIQKEEADEEKAEQLQVSVATVYVLCNRGKLPHVRIGVGRGTIRIREEDLTDFLETETVRMATKAEPSPRTARTSSGPSVFTQLNQERLHEAWRQQGVLADQPGADSAPSSSSSCDPSTPPAS